ncbi:MFS transporter [Stackebrandtia nassauensis]|uniref:Major facilitator superfamily MFS_1 n=1 Tax=Stackebrandtia nassauensis (strain DSM 44728 / CIP 108903 / NRRL B-16338 / NBRC 102104 / LLR-40K-21) TaxID=446470 RepID=D3PYZ1_STANL|nr:MFS transporter [Stackebrandtia nassauensis]ADD45420.1 major facilitator superfamily MFS_1 [Stackebrandtia nassauensis DSM 44728]
MTLTAHPPDTATTDVRAERLILPAALITCLGNNIQLTAGALLVLATERSAMAIAWVFIATAVPQALLSVPFGRLADRLDRRRLCLACDVLSGVLAVALPIALAAGVPGPTAVYTVTFGLAVLSTLFLAASNALVKERVAEVRLGRFSANFDMATSAGSLLSTAAGGVAVQLFGPEPLFVFNGLSFWASAVCWLALGNRTAAPETTPEPATTATVAPVKPPLKRLATLYALTNVIITVSNVLIVVMVVQMFHHGPGTLGLVDGLAGCGMLLAGFVYKRVRRRHEDLRIALAGFLGLVVVVVLQPSIGPAGMLLFLPGGLVFGLSRIASRTLLLSAIDERRAGRVFGSANAVALLASVAATLAVSYASDTWHPWYGFGLLGLIVVLVAPVVIGTLLRRARG